jgi:5-methyltetrahydrofolate--homocysteine methyltransferase
MGDTDVIRKRFDDEVLLLDGGLGSQLLALGLEQGEAPEHWNLEHPDRIMQVIRSYVEAGSDIVHTVSFGGSPSKLAAAGLEGRCHEVNVQAATLARQAAEPETLVAGDVGPTGRMFPPMGDATPTQLEEDFRRQVEALAEAGVDLLSIETMFDLREALAAVRAAARTGLPIIASMTFETRKRGTFTLVGDRVGPSLQALVEAGADAVGLNCSVSSKDMIPMVVEARSAVQCPLAAQPNAGQPRQTAAGVVYDAEPERFAMDLAQMVREGARIVGGCCGTSPEFIRTARLALDALPHP